MNLTNTDEPMQIVKGGLDIGPYGWSPDRNVLMYGVSDSTNDIDIRFYSIDEKVEDYVLMPDKGNQMLATFSPDGKYIAYTSDVSGQSEVYVQPFPPDGKRWIISSNGGEEPVWSPIKQSLYCRNNQDWFEINFSTADGFSIIDRNKLFTGPYINVPGHSYDITPDGKDFILLRPVSNSQTSTKLKVVKNWIDEVEILAPWNKAR
jgi:Tol biopolymer transport system component